MNGVFGVVTGQTGRQNKSSAYRNKREDDSCTALPSNSRAEKLFRNASYEIIGGETSIEGTQCRFGVGASLIYQHNR